MSLAKNSTGEEPKSTLLVNLSWLISFNKSYLVMVDFSPLSLTTSWFKYEGDIKLYSLNLLTGLYTFVPLSLDKL